MKLGLKDIWEMVKTAGSNWVEDKVPRMGAALSYYTIFSLAPLLVIAIGLAGLIFGRDAAQHQIVGQIAGIVGEPAAKAIQEMLSHAWLSGASVWATVAGVIVLLVGSTGVFVELQDALNTIWKVAPKPGRPIWEMLRERFLSLTVVVGIAFLLLVSLVVSAALEALMKFLTPASLPGGATLWEVINNLVTFGFLVLLFAFMFKALPDVKIPWRSVWVGAVVTAVLFTLGKFLIGLYIGRTSTQSAFGAAGALVLILVWVYYSAQIFFFGVELTRAYALRTEEHVAPAEHAVPLTPQDLARQGIPRTEDVQRVAQASASNGRK